MRLFENYNPIVITLYFLSMSTVLMFSQSPLLLLIGFSGIISYFCIRDKKKSFRSHLFYIRLFKK